MRSFLVVEAYASNSVSIGRICQQMIDVPQNSVDCYADGRSAQLEIDGD